MSSQEQGDNLNSERFLDLTRNDKFRGIGDAMSKPALAVGVRRFRINRQPAERGSGAVFVWARELASDRRAA
jgi:hypothetical protein